MGKEHNEIMRSNLDLAEKLEALFNRKKHWMGKEVAAVDCSECIDGSWMGSCHWIHKKDLEGMDYDLIGPSWSGGGPKYLNIIFYSRSPYKVFVNGPNANEGPYQNCMSREEVKEAGLDHPWTEHILNESTEPISPKKMVSTRKT